MIKKVVKSVEVKAWKEGMTKQQLALEAKKTFDKAVAEQRRYIRQAAKRTENRRLYAVVAIYVGIAIAAGLAFMLPL